MATGADWAGGGQPVVALLVQLRILEWVGLVRG